MSFQRVVLSALFLVACGGTETEPPAFSGPGAVAETVASSSGAGGRHGAHSASAGAGGEGAGGLGGAGGATASVASSSSHAASSVASSSSAGSGGTSQGSGGAGGAGGASSSSVGTGGGCVTCADAAFPVLLGPSQSWCPGPAAHVYNTVVECACTSTGGNVELFCGQSCRGSGNTYCHGGPISTDCLQCLEGYCGAYVTACQMY